MRGLYAEAVVAVALLASCAGSGDCTVSGTSCESTAVNIAVDPPSLVLAVGDTASGIFLDHATGLVVGETVSLVLPGQGSMDAQVRWTAGQPVVVQLDSQTVARFRVVFRASAPGTSFIGFAISVRGQTYPGMIPVTVTAR